MQLNEVRWKMTGLDQDDSGGRFDTFESRLGFTKGYYFR